MLSYLKIENLYIKNVNRSGIETATTCAEKSGAGIKVRSKKTLLKPMELNHTIGKKNKLVKINPFI